MRDYDELVRRLREAPNDWPDADLHYEAADAIEELNKPKWISVKERKKMTNADKIRAMSNEELATLLESKCPTAKCLNLVMVSGSDQCYRCWLDWLKLEAESDD